jgi:hypothetical protein
VDEYWRQSRRVATWRKWLTSLRGNGLWVFKGLPVMVVLATSAVACISHVFFGIPFLRATRMPKGGRPVP